MSENDEKPMIDLEGSAGAPILVFDEAPFCSVMPGMGRVTLSAIIQDEDGNGGLKFRRVVVAHLRGNAIAFASLREAIDKMEFLATGPSAPEGPVN